jgi:HKD family nuclease
MPDIPRLPLSEFFQRLAPAYVLGTTYTISLAFFEGLVLPQVRRENLRRCLLLCDRVGFQRAVVESSALRGASREYMTACTPSRHSFHPKVWLLIGEEQAALLVGSGNLTQSGFMDNAELFEAVTLKQGGPHRTVAEDVITFLSGLRRLWTGKDSEHLLPVETLRQMEEAMRDISKEMPEEQEGDLRFLTSFHGPLCEQFANYFEDGGSLMVAAPYFGGSIAAVSLLRSQLSPARIKVFPATHPDQTIDVPLKKLSDVPGVSVLPLRLAEAQQRFCHLKLYGFESAKGQWIYTGSANCTTAALEAENVEAGLMRRAKKGLLKQYFAASSDKSLPAAQRAKSFSNREHVLLLWAADRTGAIELVTAEQEAIALPLQEVELTLQLGAEASCHDAPSLFDTGHTERIPWEWFPHKGDRTKSTPLLTVRAVSATGVSVQGAAFVDFPLLLTSDPMHRSAWRAAVTLLDTGGLPEAADLCSIFNLIHTVFDQEETANSEVVAPSTQAGEHQPSAAPDKIAIWPPEPDQSVFSHLPRGSHVHTLHWFQTILKELLHRPDGEGTEVEDRETDADDEEGDAREQPAPSPRVRKAAQAAWSYAEDSFEQLVWRLDEHEVTRAAAPKIWPVAVAILLVALATRRQCLRHRDAGAELPLMETLLSRFVWALFKDRCRHFGLDDNHGRVPSLPSVAEALHTDYKADPTEDIADILMLLFAFFYVRGERSRCQFPLNEWLLFRDIAPQTIASAANRKEEFRPAARRFFVDESEGITWELIAAGLDSLQTCTWEAHPGLKDLRALMVKAQSGAGAGAAKLPARLQDQWYQTDARIRRGKKWLFRVGRFTWSCQAPDCVDNASLDPTKRVLWELRPTICRSCGAVLVPDRLANYAGIEA